MTFEVHALSMKMKVNGAMDEKRAPFRLQEIKRKSDYLTNWGNRQASAGI